MVIEADGSRDTNDTKSPASDIGTIRTGVMVPLLPKEPGWSAP
jgi:hypothetical protein